MLEMRPDCERCDKDLSGASTELLENFPTSTSRVYKPAG
jgi:hypothetical protein